MPSFSSSKTWECLRPHESSKDWFSAVWFKGAIPKHAFLMWISTLDRLPTRTRLASWGMQIPSTCCLCSVFDETRDHLLLRCEVSLSLWRLTLCRMGFRDLRFQTWIAMLAWTKTGGTNSPSILRKIAAHATIYHLWWERNNRFHNQQTTPISVLFKQEDRHIRNTISSKRHRRKFKDLMGIWLQ
ncbi:hypothetical protein V5N11_008307 [Cardamine amara subsp. amara]|uniref:Reverse transcriptase zinc-binding domain-containing protein n=1 Tax=Cardamine amara subsp. amara TaxID=228776 RepID=A0ABD0Z9D8_CARAN